MSELDPALTDAIVSDTVNQCAVVVRPSGVEFLGAWSRVQNGTNEAAVRVSVCRWAIAMLEQKLREIPQ